MINKMIKLTSVGKANLVTYIHEEFDVYKLEFQILKRPAIIIMPGGAYAFLSPNEAEPVALTFLKEGFNTFVLNYSVGEESEYPALLEEVSRAIWEVRKRADEWNINPNAIAVMGFSAGAGVASMAATQWNSPGLAKSLGIPEGGNKPNALIIGYGSSDTRTYMDDSFENKLSLGKIAAKRDPHLDVVNFVGEDTPPAFIWHTRNDHIIPSDQPLRMAIKMQEFNLQYELHVFQFGDHGMSVFNNLSSYQAGNSGECRNVGLWVQMCTNWLCEIFQI